MFFFINNQPQNNQPKTYLSNKLLPLLESINIVIVGIRFNIRYYISGINILKLLLKIFALRLVVYLIASLPILVNICLAIIGLGIFLDYYDRNKCNIRRSINYIINNKLEFLINKFFSFIVVSFLIFFGLTTLIIIDTNFNTNIFPLLSKSPLMMLIDTSLVSGYLVLMEGMGSNSGGNYVPPQGPQPPQAPQPPQGPHTLIPITSKQEQNRLFHDSDGYLSQKEKTVEKLDSSFINRPEGVKTYSMNDPDYHERFTPLDHNTVCRHFAHHPRYKNYINTNQDGDFVYTGKINKAMIHALSQPKVT
jgi:hypothetical protein